MCICIYSQALWQECLVSTVHACTSWTHKHREIRAFLALQPYWGYRTQLCSIVERTELCNNSGSSVVYGRATRTSITVVSKFPEKPGELHMWEQWIPGAPLWFLSAWEWGYSIYIYMYIVCRREGDLTERMGHGEVEIISTVKNENYILNNNWNIH